MISRRSFVCALAATASAPQVARRASRGGYHPILTG
jgi:hypothetical protein